MKKTLAIALGLLVIAFGAFKAINYCDDGRACQHKAKVPYDGAICGACEAQKLADEQADEQGE